jgi:hypothetical protein
MGEKTAASAGWAGAAPFEVTGDRTDPADAAAVEQTLDNLGHTVDQGLRAAGVNPLDVEPGTPRTVSIPGLLDGIDAALEQNTAQGGAQ